MTDNKNTILAIVLSALVLLGWQYFFAVPQEKARQEQLQRTAAKADRADAGPTGPGRTAPRAKRNAGGSRPDECACSCRPSDPRSGVGWFAARVNRNR